MIITAPAPASFPFSEKAPDLLDHHFRHLVESSGISVEVVLERGYRSVLDKKVLAGLGFSRAQQRTPGILIPLHAPDGSPAGWQYRPDHPRLNNRGKPIKYETPAGGALRLDVPPRCCAELGNPSVPLIITEGAKKADALASHDCCPLDLPGVWGFKRRNEFGGVAFLADFDHIALNGREIDFAFDSDLATNRHVGQALGRLGEHLRRKGAKLFTIRLPQDGDKKVGVDDYLLTHSVDELLALREPFEPGDGVAEPTVRHVTGFVLGDGTIGEMVLADDGTAFAVKRPDGTVAILAEYQAGGTVYRPMADGQPGRTVKFAPGVAAYGTMATLFAEVRAFLHRYVELPLAYEDLAALYVLLTWIHDPLPTVPYLRALGDYGLGKSRLLDVLGAIVFRAITASGATTTSPIFRILEDYQGTLVLDESDFSRSDAQADIIKILNSGYKPGTPVLRSVPVGAKDWQVRGFRVFGPKVIATRKRFGDRALESRCLTWEAEGLSRNDIPIVLGPRFRAEAAKLQAKLLAFRFDYLPKMLDLNLEDARPVGNLEPRLQEIVLPLQALAEGNAELQTVLGNFICAKQEEMTADRRNSLPALVLEAIIALHDEGGELSAKAIAGRLNEEGIVKDHLDKPEMGITPRRVGATIRGPLGLRMRDAVESRRSVVLFDEARIRRRAHYYGIPIPEKEASQASLSFEKLHL